MPARTKKNLSNFRNKIENWDNIKYRKETIMFMDKIGTEELFEILYSMRRWYAGGTMFETLYQYRDVLGQVMDLSPGSVVGAYRGFKTLIDDPLAQTLKEGQILDVPVARNRGFSSWTTDIKTANKFSGASPGKKIGIIIQLIDSKEVYPVLAPPNKTSPWFNALYDFLMSGSFRHSETEYLIKASKIKVKVVKIKK